MAVVRKRVETLFTRISTLPSTVIFCLPYPLISCLLGLSGSLFSLSWNVNPTSKCFTHIVIIFQITFHFDSLCSNHLLDISQSFNRGKRWTLAATTFKTLSVLSSVNTKNTVFSLLRPRFLDDSSDSVVRICTETASFSNSCTNLVWKNGSETNDSVFSIKDGPTSYLTALIAPRTTNIYAFHGKVHDLFKEWVHIQHPVVMHPHVFLDYMLLFWKIRNL